jgi:energy-converting hydrogenase A subunit K
MNKENGFIALISLVIIGIIIVTALATILQEWTILLPLAILAIIILPLALLQNKKSFAHITERIENIVFIVTLAIIAISFILLFKPL